MSDRDALLAAILANPDEDTPRLVFADWLQENGDAARAEFVRVQCELARLAGAARDLPDWLADQTTEYTDGPNRVAFTYWRHYAPRRIELLRRQAELLTPDRRTEWGAGLPKYASGPGTSWSLFRRGFVGAVRVSLTGLLKDPPALWAHQPVEALELSSVSGQTTTAKVPRCAHLSRVRELSFLWTGKTPLLAPFARCPHLAGLRSLRIASVAPSVADAAEFAHSEHLWPESLSFSAQGLPRESFEALVQGHFASRLRELEVESANEWALEVVAAAPLGGLRQLRLAGAGCGDPGVEALTQSKSVTGLVTLGLGGNNLSDETAERLAGWPGLACVRALDLSDADITGAGIETLVASPHFRPAYLSLCYTSAGDIGAAALARWPGLADVVHLDLRYAQVCDTGAIALARSPHWRDLRSLMLGGSTFRRAHGPLHERFGSALNTYG